LPPAVGKTTTTGRRLTNARAGRHSPAQEYARSASSGRHLTPRVVHDHFTVDEVPRPAPLGNRQLEELLGGHALGHGHDGHRKAVAQEPRGVTPRADSRDPCHFRAPPSSGAGDRSPLAGGAGYGRDLEAERVKLGQPLAHGQLAILAQPPGPGPRPARGSPCSKHPSHRCSGTWGQVSRGAQGMRAVLRERQPADPAGQPAGHTSTLITRRPPTCFQLRWPWSRKRTSIRPGKWVR